MLVKLLYAILDHEEGLPVVEAIITANPALLSSRPFDAQSLAEYVAEKGSSAAIRRVKILGAELSAKDRPHNLIFYALWGDNGLQSVVTEDDFVEAYQDGTTQLMAYAAAGRLGGMKDALLSLPKDQRQAEIEKQNVRGENALYYAGLAGNEACVKYLIDSWAPERITWDMYRLGVRQYLLKTLTNDTIISDTPRMIDKLFRVIKLIRQIPLALQTVEDKQCVSDCYAIMGSNYVAEEDFKSAIDMLEKSELHYQGPVVTSDADNALADAYKSLYASIQMLRKINVDGVEVDGDALFLEMMKKDRVIIRKYIKTYLIYAASEDDVPLSEVIRLCQAQPTLVNERHVNHKTLPLEFALEGGSLAKVRYFIEDAKVSLDCSNSFCNYYLRATDNTEDVQEYMLKLAQRMPTVFNDGMTDILVAAIANNVDAIAAKVAATPLERRSELLAVVDSRGLGIVYYAAAAGAADVIQYLFEHGLASQEQQSEELRYGLTALCNGIKLNKSRRNADHQRLEDKARRAIIMASYLPVDGGKASRFQADLLHLQAGIYSLVKKHEQALTAIQRALRMYQNVNTVARDEWHRDMAIMLRDAADIYHELKKFKLARDSMEEASKHIAAIDEQDESDAKLEKICHVRDQMAAECDQLQLKADQHELAMVLVPEDGDCFYTAVALQLAQSDDEDLKGLSAHDLRMLAVEYICTRRDEYAGFMEGDFDEYLARHSKARTWADNVMITALANALSLNIVIIAGRYDEWTVFKRSGNKTVCLGFIPEFHYVAMPSKAAPLSASPSVLRVLAAQQEDGVTPPQPCVQPVEVHVGEKNESTNEEQPGPAKRPRIHSPAESFAVEAMVGLSSAGAVPTKSVSPVQTTAMLMERFGVGSTAAYVSADQVNAKEAMAHSGHDDNFPMVTDAQGLADKSNPTTTLRPS